MFVVALKSATPEQRIVLTELEKSQPGDRQR